MSLLTGVGGLRCCRTSDSFWLVLDDADPLGSFVLKWNSLGMVTERTVFSGAGSAARSQTFVTRRETDGRSVGGWRRICGLTASQRCSVASLILPAVQSHFLLEGFDTIKLLFFRTIISIYK